MKKTNKQFISSSTFTVEEIEEILQAKIKEETQKVEDAITQEEKDKEQAVIDTIQYDESKINIVSLFSGCGGLDLGVELAGLVAQYGQEKAYQLFQSKVSYDSHRNKLINFIFSNDLFESANQSYLKNFPDTTYKSSKNIQKVSLFPKSNIMLGGFPCPGFSVAGPRLLDDERNFLYIHYIRALMQSKPEFFIAENVKGLMTLGKGKVLEQISEDFAAAGYVVTAHLVNARDYGVPQLRERVFIIGVRKDIQKKFNYVYQLPPATHGPEKEKYVTLKDAIGDLPLEPSDVFDSTYSSMYMSRNRKKSWEEQSFTIQASARQAPQHPHGFPMKKIDKETWVFQGKHNRRLSVRECARIQTFPDWFEFSNGNKLNVTENHRLNEQYKQIGNAVPVMLAEKIARPIVEFYYKNIL
ncbi:MULTISPECIES: DNA cytosine methyltransferase [Streptococcus]|uniref:DNA cytosine methyltransferase n=1 Tax=Streptococcus TaxID=1301 RepID=UPI0004018D9D|nr:DNA cytosine methyltransferase [Streptococcus suis]MCL4922743.1 DNA cytosine methyltransferase [Streptococcus suis]NQJ51023.1 DNA cytosine methyltransferase [Streptococcus suis]NQJ53131.1 DNA cytosine methyltransferase [Streptococcus suis]NQJ57524.1 DNA cytosine methyltransferase [Streptococcus suis]HEM3202258.1 DNA cytosine methyltransferase [Streptococcus suis 8830]